MIKLELLFEILVLLIGFNSILLQQIISGVYSMKILNSFKSKKFPADWLSITIFKKCFQLIAKYNAGTIKNLPAKTGNDNNNKIAVTNTLHTNKGTLWKLIPLVLIFIKVLMKFIAPKSEDTPDKCKLKIAKSTEGPEWDWIPDKGGYHYYSLIVLFYYHH